MPSSVQQDEEDNPWLSAASNESFSRTRLNLQDEFGVFLVNRDQQQQQQQQQQHQSFLTDKTNGSSETKKGCCGCGQTMTRVIILAWLFFDLIVGSCLLLAAFLYKKQQHHQHENIISISLWTLAAIYLVRAISGGVSMHYTFCRQCGLLVAANLSPILAIIYFIGTFIVLIQGKQFPIEVVPIFIPTTAAVLWLKHHILYVSLFCFASSLLECAKWQLLQSYRRGMLRGEDSEQDLSVITPTRNTTTAVVPPPRRLFLKRPWWWSHDSESDALAQPFLSPDRPTQMATRRQQQQQPEQKRSWWWPFQRRTNNIRDDGSVDFASVQEEWASRTEEDPYWWTRDEQQQQQQQW